MRQDMRACCQLLATPFTLARFVVQLEKQTNLVNYYLVGTFYMAEKYDVGHLAAVLATHKGHFRALKLGFEMRQRTFNKWHALCLCVCVCDGVS